MIDFHCHIIPLIDDGSRSMEESILIAKEAEKSGFKSIFCTSHFMEESYILKDENQFLLNNLREQLILESIDVNLYSGNEVYISLDLIDWIDKNKFQTLNNSKYFLMEIPMQVKVSYLNDIIFKAMLKGYIPIIAHPERYKFVQDDPNFLISLIESGVLFQMNYGSILGFYGKQVEKTAAILLKNNMIHFLGSDTHRKNTFYKNIDQAILKIKNIIGEEAFEDLSLNNAQIVFKNGNIKTKNPTIYKKPFFKSHSSL